jgi:serine/threonine protein kinase
MINVFSKMYNRFGEIIEIPDNINGTPIFRKEFYDDSNYEKDIVEKLLSMSKSSNLINVVKIYKVEYKYYDSELLNTDIQVNKEIIQTLIDSMINAKEELQSRGIIYIDWKLDNIGIDANGVYKIFDFDSSGLVNINSKEKEWIKPPPHRWLYQKACKNGLYSPIDIDNECFNIFCKELRETLNIL